MMLDTLSLMIRVLGGLALILAVPASVLGQTTYESVGSRALGMAGAFVAVADDATAAYWNPAGLATGTPAGGTVEWVRFHNGDRRLAPKAGPGLRTATFSAVGSWPLAVSYGRLTTTVVTLREPGMLVTERLATSQYGVTVLQTVVQGLVVGSTLKYVRGSVSEGPAEGLTVGEVLDVGAALDGRSSGAFDLDVGIMADLQKLRVGVSWKNLRTPSFTGTSGTAVELPRLARLGIAVLPTSGLTLAMDVDLDTVDLRDGLRRMIATGGEGRLGARLTVRGGVRWNLEGEARRPVAAVGASILLQRGLWLDAHLTRGGIDEDRGFGFALRAGY